MNDVVATFRSGPLFCRKLTLVVDAKQNIGIAFSGCWYEAEVHLPQQWCSAVCWAEGEKLEVDVVDEQAVAPMHQHGCHLVSGWEKVERFVKQQWTIFFYN
jgi:hypothetical protein